MSSQKGKGFFVDSDRVVILESPSDLVCEATEKLSKDNSLEIYRARTDAEFREAVGQHAPCLLLIAAAGKEDLAVCGQLMSEFGPMIRKQLLKAMMVSKIDDPRIDASFRKLGCSEVVLESLPVNSFVFKVRLHLKALKAATQKNHPQENKTKLARGKDREAGAKVEPVKSEPEMKIEVVPTGKEGDEVWRFSKEEEKKKDGNWSVEKDAAQSKELEYRDTQDAKGRPLNYTPTPDAPKPDWGRGPAKADAPAAPAPAKKDAAVSASPPASADESKKAASELPAKPGAVQKPSPAPAKASKSVPASTFMPMAKMAPDYRGSSAERKALIPPVSFLVQISDRLSCGYHEPPILAWIGMRIAEMTSSNGWMFLRMLRDDSSLAQIVYNEGYEAGSAAGQIKRIGADDAIVDALDREQPQRTASDGTITLVHLIRDVENDLVGIFLLKRLPEGGGKAREYSEKEIRFFQAVGDSVALMLEVEAELRVAHVV